jgi:uncharacterized membrane protein
MSQVIRIPKHKTSLFVIVIKIFALFIFTMGCIWILIPNTQAISVRFTPWVILGSLLAVLFFIKSAYTRKTVLILTAIAVSGYFIEVIGVNTGLIFGPYTYGKALGIAWLNTPLIIGINWLFLVYASSSVFEKLNIPLIVKILLSSLVMLAYDIILEPVADKLDMWHWMNTVVPFQNYIAWFVIAFLFHSLLKWSATSTRNSLAPWMLLCQFLFFITLRLFLKEKGMIVKAHHHKIVYPFFRWYTLHIISRNFKSVHISGNFHDKGLPVLLIANHVSWWDGFWVSYLNLKIFKRKYHFMMLEEQLKAFPVLNQTGGYSVKKGNRSVLASLQYTARLLEEPGNAVLFFPQGKIQSMHAASFHFEKGIGKLLENIENKIQVFFIVNLIDYFSHIKPELYIFFREYPAENHDMDVLQNEYNMYYSSCISEQQQKTDP